MNKFLIIFMIMISWGLVSCGKVTSDTQNADSTAVAAVAEYYTCPMHPQVRSDRPGACPVCGMDLVKASNSRTTAGMDSGDLLSLEDRDKVLANVATVRVEYEEVLQTVKAFGTLEIPEPNKTVVSARFGGRIEDLHVDAVGRHVSAGDPLFEIYSPEIIQAETEYQQAFRSNTASAHENLESARARLILLGMTKDQIHELESIQTVPLVVTYYSPADGIVISKNVVKGSYVSEGTTLYEVADITTLWNIADVYESDAGLLRIGEIARFTVASYPGEIFTGRIALVYPVVNPQTRTVKVRVAVDNAAERLKSNMYTETIFRRQKGKSLTVPVGAVLQTGRRNLVYVQAGGENHYQAREVGLGVKFNDKFEILWGLSAGDVVVSQGGYLIDSESQLRTGDTPAHAHEEAIPAQMDAGGGSKEHKH